MAIFEKTIRNQKFNTLLRKLEQEILSLIHISEPTRLR